MTKYMMIGSTTEGNLVACEFYDDLDKAKERAKERATDQPVGTWGIYKLAVSYGTIVTVREHVEGEPEEEATPADRPAGSR